MQKREIKLRKNLCSILALARYANTSQNLDLSSFSPLNIPMANEGKFNYPNYTDEEHETWSLLYKKQMELLPGRACGEFLEGLSKLNFNPQKIPYLGDVSEVLKKSTGWNLVRVEGLVPEKEFFELLAKKEFPSTDFIRVRGDLNYTPAPDMFHDLFGHMSMITNPTFAKFFQAMGKAGAKAQGDVLKEVQKLYWFTVEFGLIQGQGEKRIYGSGILSSPGEVVYCLTDKVKVYPFDVSAIIKQDYDIWHMQEELFAIESFEQLEKEFISFGQKRALL
jgi:phenylalanine-4-hydroxylase